MTQKFNPKKTLEHTLNVGNFLSFRKDFGLFDIHYLGYAGMPSKETFSMIYGDANMFFPISKKEMNIHKKRFEILSVDAEKIKLKYLREE